MNPDRDDERLEAYLRQFEARAPRPLPVKSRPVARRLTVVMVALAATLLIAASLRVWQSRMKHSGPPVTQQTAQTPAEDEISLGQLSRIARQDPEKLDSELDRLSPGLLPNPDGSQGVLNRLSRE